MRMPPDTIALGARRFEIRPLTIAQVQAIEPLLMSDGQQTAASSIATAVAILRIALARDHAEAAAEIDTFEAGAPEIGTAMAQVLRLGGFLPAGGRDVTPGEAEADRGAAKPRSASTGPSSMQG